MTYQPRTNYGDNTAAYHDLTHSPVGLWQFNGDMVDVSGNSLGLTVSTGAERYSELGSSGLKGFFFNGATGLKRATHDASLTVYGALTVEMIVSFSSAAAACCVAFGYTGETEATNTLYSLQQTVLGEPYYLSENSTGTDSGYTFSTVGLPVGVPTHLAITRSSNGTVIKCYVNGKLYGTSTALTIPTGGSSSLLYVGVDVDGGTFLPKGSVLSSLKVIASTLTDAQVLAEYQRTLGRSQVTKNAISVPRRVPIDPATSINWLMDSTNPYTNQGFGAAATLSLISGATVTQRSGIFGQGLVVISGSSGILTTGDTSAGESSSVSISCWLKLRAYRAQYGDIVSKNYNLNSSSWGAGGNYYIGFSMTNSADGTLSANTTTGTNNTFNPTIAEDRVPLDTWTLLSMTYNETTGEMILYKNGSAIASRTVTAAPLAWGAHGPWYIGGNPKVSSDYIDGMIDDVRIESVVRSPEYFEDMYRKGLGLYDTYGAGPNTTRVTSITASYQVLNLDEVISVGVISAPITVTLPSAPTQGEKHVIKDASGSASTYAITVSGNGKTIDGSATSLVNQNYATLRVTYNGTQWMIL